MGKTESEDAARRRGGALARQRDGAGEEVLVEGVDVGILEAEEGEAGEAAGGGEVGDERGEALVAGEGAEVLEASGGWGFVGEGGKGREVGRVGEGRKGRRE